MARARRGRADRGLPGGSRAPVPAIPWRSITSDTTPRAGTTSVRALVRRTAHDTFARGIQIPIRCTRPRGRFTWRAGRATPATGPHPGSAAAGGHRCAHSCCVARPVGIAEGDRDVHRSAKCLWDASTVPRSPASAFMSAIGSCRTSRIGAWATVAVSCTLPCPA